SWVKSQLVLTLARFGPTPRGLALPLRRHFFQRRLLGFFSVDANSKPTAGLSNRCAIAGRPGEPGGLRLPPTIRLTKRLTHVPIAFTYGTVRVTAFTCRARRESGHASFASAGD